MASTCEIACLGFDHQDAFLKALISVGFRLPVRAVLLSNGPIESRAALINSARALEDAGVKMYGTGGTAAFVAGRGIEVLPVSWRSMKAAPKPCST